MKIYGQVHICLFYFIRSYVEAEETKRKELGIDTEEIPLEILHDNQGLAEKGDICKRGSGWGILVKRFLT